MTLAEQSDRGASHQLRHRRGRHPQPAVVHSDDSGRVFQRLEQHFDQRRHSPISKSCSKASSRTIRTPPRFRTRFSPPSKPSNSSRCRPRTCRRNSAASRSGGIYNFTSKSGTNQFHGSVYSYLENTAFNAGIPFTDDGTGHHQNVVKHLADYGGTIGGPVWIPHVYDGHNKTFFFFNLERYRDREALYNGITTVPNAEFLAGNLSNNLAVTGTGISGPISRAGRSSRTRSTIPRPPLSIPAAGACCRCSPTTSSPAAASIPSRRRSWRSSPSPTSATICT